MKLTRNEDKMSNNMSELMKLVEGIKYLIGCKATNETKITQLEAVITDLQEQAADDLAELMAANAAINAVKDAVKEIPSDTGGGMSMGGINTASVSGNSMVGANAEGH